tara:strand:- start:7271 stop:7465 length:195 start_codon:yes stop_codon:yes gene_type:complete
MTTPIRCGDISEARSFVSFKISELSKLHNKNPNDKDIKRELDEWFVVFKTLRKHIQDECKRAEK